MAVFILGLYVMAENHVIIPDFVWTWAWVILVLTVLGVVTKEN